MTLRFLPAALIVAVLCSCNNDLDLTAPYKENTIVYALLDKDSATQYIKINKAFLGDGNAFVYAQEPDSTEYTAEQLEAHVLEVKDGAVVDSFPLRDTLLPHDPGIFAGPTHKLYCFNAELDSSAIYRLEATAKGNHVYAETPVVGGIKPMEPTLSQPMRLVMAGGGYANITFRWHSATNAKRYELSYRFNWDEVKNGDTLSRSFTQPMGTIVSNGLGGNESMLLDYPAEAILQTIGLRMGNDPDVTQRIFRGIDLIWAVAGPDLHTYLQLNSPISGIVEERPSYSNVTNGYGLFSTRRFRVLHKSLDANSVPELVDGQYTGALLFCVPGADAQYSCN